MAWGPQCLNPALSTCEQCRFHNHSYNMFNQRLLRFIMVNPPSSPITPPLDKSNTARNCVCVLSHYIFLRFFFFFFIRMLPSEITEQNSTKLCHMFGIGACFQIVARRPKLGIPSPKTSQNCLFSSGCSMTSQLYHEYLQKEITSCRQTKQVRIVTNSDCNPEPF